MNDETKQVRQAHPIKWTEDVRIECSFPGHLHLYARQHPYASEDYWKAVEKETKAWVKDFHDFIRDHRSQDPVSLSVVRDEVVVCSLCGGPWETMPDDARPGEKVCAYCEEVVEPVLEKE